MAGIPGRHSQSGYGLLLRMVVGVTGLEPATSSSRTTRATDCATPRLTIHCREVERGGQGHTVFRCGGTLRVGPSAVGKGPPPGPGNKDYRQRQEGRHAQVHADLGALRNRATAPVGGNLGWRRRLGRPILRLGSRCCDRHRGWARRGRSSPRWLDRSQRKVVGRRTCRGKRPHRSCRRNRHDRWYLGRSRCWGRSRHGCSCRRWSCDERRRCCRCERSSRSRRRG